MSDWGLMQAVSQYNKSMAQPSQWQQKPQLPAPSGPGQSYHPDSGVLPAWAVGHAGGGGFNDNMGGWNPNPSLPAPSGPGKSYTPGTGFLGGGMTDHRYRPYPGDLAQPMPRPYPVSKPPVWQPQPGQGGFPQPDPSALAPGVTQDDWFRKFGQNGPAWPGTPDTTMPVEPYNPPPSNGGIVINPGNGGLDALPPWALGPGGVPRQGPGSTMPDGGPTFKLPDMPSGGTSFGPGPMADRGGMIAPGPAQRDPGSLEGAAPNPLDQNLDGIDDRIFQSQQRQTQIDSQLKMKQLEAKREQAQLMQTRKRMEQQRRQQEQLAKQAQMAQPIGQFGNSWNQFQDMRRKFVGQTTPMFNSPLAGNGTFARSYGTPEGSLPRNTAPYLME